MEATSGGKAGPANVTSAVDSLTAELERMQSTPADRRSLHSQDGEQPGTDLGQHTSDSAESVMRELTRHAIMAQQEAERRAMLAEKLAEDITVHHETQKQQWLTMNASLREHIARILEEARNAALKKRKERRRKTTDTVDLEAQQHAAQLQADLLRAVVTPMEAEIADLKRRLVRAQKRSASATSPDMPTRDPLLPPAIDAESVFGSTARVAELKAVQQELKTERQRRAEIDIAVHLKETEIQVLIADLASVKMAYEQEKAALADAKAARDKLGAKSLSAIRSLQQHIAQLERGAANGGGGKGGVAVGGEAAVCEDGDALAAAPVRNHLATAVAELGDLMVSLRREHDAIRQAGSQDWTLRRAQYESEAKALRHNLEAAHKRIATLEETVADLNAASVKPCDYCADYEYKVVVMQEEVRKAQQQVRDTEAKVAIAVADVEKRVDEATLRNSRHLMRSMDDLERKMALKAKQQLMAQDEQNKANTAVIREALDKQAAAIEDLENALAAALPKVDAQAKKMTELRRELGEANARAAAAIKRHNETLEAQSAARDQNRVILMQYKEERDALKAELASLRAAAADAQVSQRINGAPLPDVGAPWWFWLEDPDRLHLHPSGWVLDDGYVAFPSAVSSRIEEHLLSGRGGTLLVSLAPSIAEEHTDRGAMLAPVEYELDLAARTQKDVGTGEVRPIVRRTAPPGAMVRKASPTRTRAQSNASAVKPSTPKKSSTMSSPVGAVARVMGMRRRSNSDVGAMLNGDPSHSRATPSKLKSPPRPSSSLSEDMARDIDASSNV